MRQPADLLLKALLTSCLMLACSALAGAEITVVTRKDGGGREHYTFYRDGEEIARALAREGSGQGTGRDFERFEGEVPAGEVMEYYSRGRLKTRWRVIERLNRVQTHCRLEEYYPSGTLEFKFERDGCEMNGDGLAYFESGLPSIIETWLGGRREGLSTHYYDDKRKRVLKETLYRKGLREGVEKMYRQDGSLWSETNYKGDKREGLSILHNENGARTETEYKDDVQSGLERNYDKRGKLWCETPFSGGKPSGVQKYFSPKTGKLAMQISYRGGVLNGESREYHEGKEGQVRCVLTYTGGTLTARKSYDIAGKPSPSADRSSCRSLENFIQLTVNPNSEKRK